jgi:hypothetical protein
MDVVGKSSSMDIGATLWPAECLLPEDTGLNSIISGFPK